MDLIQKYIYQIYKEKSFSSAAKSLYISQPALSAAVGRLEKEMGIKIFDRSKKPLSLTQQGIIYIEALEEIISAENNMQRRFRELSDMSYGSLSVGGSSYASYALMAKTSAEFNRRYPKVKVLINLGNVGKIDVLSETLIKGELDLLFSYTTNNNKFTYTPITEEKIIIAMHKKLIKNKPMFSKALDYNQLVSGDYDKRKEITDFSIFNDTEFIAYENNSLTDRIMTEMLGDFKTVPCTIKNSRHSEMHYNMMREGLGAVVIPSLPVIHFQNNDDNILYFVPHSKEFSRKIYLASSPHSDKNPIIKNYINIAKELFTQ